MDLYLERLLKNFFYALQADFSLSDGTLTTSVSNTFSGIDSQNVQTIEVVGISADSINAVTVNGNGVTSFTFSNGRLTIDGLTESLSAGIEMSYF